MTILLAVFIVLQINDVVTTALLLKRGGKELNPVIARFIELFGSPTGIIVAKIPAIAAVAWASLSGIFPVWLLLALCVAYAFVLINNLKVLTRL